MIGPKPDGWQIEIGMLARPECPWSSHADGHAKTITRENFNIGLGATSPNIAHYKASKSNRSLQSPDSNNTIEH